MALEPLVGGITNPGTLAQRFPEASTLGSLWQPFKGHQLSMPCFTINYILMPKETNQLNQSLETIILTGTGRLTYS